LRIVYSTVSKPFAYWALDNISEASVHVSQELIFDPQSDSVHCERSTGNDARKLRNKVSHARRHHVSVSEYVSPNEQLEEEINNVSTLWLKGRKGPQIYLAHVHLFATRKGKRWFYAKQKTQNGDRIIGVLLLDHLESKNGWYINLLIAVPDAPHGTSELLAVSVLETLRQEGCSYVTVGTMPVLNLEEMIGFGPVSTKVTKAIFKVVKRVFPLDSRTVYWKKFQPTRYENNYLLLAKSRFGFREILGVLDALNASF